MPRIFRLLHWMMPLLILITGCQITSQPTATPLSVDTIHTETPKADAGPTITQEIVKQPENVTSTPELTPQSSPTPTPEPTEPANETWVKIFGGNHENMASDIALAPDGGFLIVGGIGTLFYEGQEGGILLIKTDSAGNLLWQKVYGGEEYDSGWAITPTQDGHFLIAGETDSYGAGGMDIYLIKVDPDGNEIWSRTYGSSLDEAISSVQLTVDGGYLLIGNQVDPEDIITDPGTAGYAGFAGRSNIHLIKIDADGDEEWSRTFESTENVIASSGLPSANGGFLILATIISFPSLENDLYLLKIDPDGNEIWSRTWDEAGYAGYNFIQTSDQHYLITGIFETNENPVSDVYLLKIDGDGNQIWRSHFGDPDSYEAGKGLLESQEGDIIILCNIAKSLFSGKSSILLVAADEAGNFLWDQSLNFFYFSKVSAILQHPDGGFVITGAASSRGDTHNAFLIKTDADGNVTANIETVYFP